MGGKTKQSQRTKNNVRPSSSGRSAEILTSTIKVDSSFLTPGQGKVLPTLFPTLTATNIDQNLSPEYSVCFKKFNKKDPVTKIKALQELLELVKNGNVDEVVTALPSWAHYYQPLSIDIDRRVREAAQVCHGAIISACGRQVAPQLRRLLPAWLLAQYDEHAPVSSLAQAQLTNTFPEGKLSEAISFCKAEIIALLIDNLTGNAEAMLSNKVMEPEERSLQTARLAAGSLRALRQLAAAAHAWLWDAAAPLLRAQAFWKLAAHESHLVRAAWYGAVAGLLARHAERVPREAGARALRALLALPERAPAPAAARWPALLLLLQSTQEWDTWLDKKDLLVKRFLDLLENGAWGEARLLSDLMLPLLEKLPEELINKEFYTTLFNALLTGLENKSILNSRSERQIWVKNISECLRFLSEQRAELAAEAAAAHRAWLARALATPPAVRARLLPDCAAHMAALARHWLRAQHDLLVRNFWQNIGSTVSAQIEQLSVEENEITQLIHDHTLLFKTLKTSFDQEKKQRSIQFADEKTEKVDVEPENVVAYDKTLTDRFNHNLNETVERTCCLYFDFAHNKMMSRAIFSSLITLLVEFDSKNLFLAISRHFNADSIYSFYDKVLKNWLSGDTMRCETLVEVVFLIDKYFTEEEQENMYNSFQQFPPLVVEWCLAAALARRGAAARRWLRGGVAQAAALALARRPDARARALLLRCFRHDDGEVLVSPAAVEQAVAAQCAALRAGAAARPAARLAAALAGGREAARAAPLLRELYCLNLRLEPGAARAEARAAWRGALAALGGARAAVLHEALHDLHDLVYGNLEELGVPRLQLAAALCPRALARRVLAPPAPAPAPARDPATHALRADCIFGNLNCPFEDENELIQQVVSDADKEHEELTKQDLMLYVHRNLFRAFLLRAMLSRNAGFDEEDGDGGVDKEGAGGGVEVTGGCEEEGAGGGVEDGAGGGVEDGAGGGEEEGESEGAALLQDELYRDQFELMLEEFMVLNSLYERYAFWEHYDIIKISKERMEKLIEDILSEIPTDIQNTLLSHLTEVAATRGYYWAFARRFLEVKMNQMAQKTCESQNQTPETPEIPETDDDPESSKSDEADVSSKSETDEAKESTESDVPETGGAMDLIDMSKLEEIVTGTGYFHSLQAELKWCAESPAQLARAERAAGVLLLRGVAAAHAQHAALLAALAAALRAGAAALDAVIDVYYRHNDVMLYERDLNSAPWSQVVSNACAADALRLAVRRRGAELPPHVWDFAAISLCSLAASLRASAPRLDTPKVALMARAVLELFVAVRECAGGVRALALRRALAPHVLARAAEWDDVFAPDLNANLFELMLLVLEEEGEERAMSLARASVAGALAAARGALQWARLPARLPAARLAAAAAAALRRAPHPARLCLADALLRAVDEPLVLDDAEKVAAWAASDSAEDAEEGGAGAGAGEGVWAARDAQLALLQLEEPLRHLTELLDALLHDVEVMVGTCEPVAGSGAARVALAALLAARALLRRAGLARGDLHHCYVRVFRERKFASLVLPGALRLLPAAALGERVPPALLAHFHTPVELDVHEACLPAATGALAAGVAAAALGAGAEARAWAGALPPRAAAALRRLVRAAVAPALRGRQLAPLRARAAELAGVRVLVHAARGRAELELRADDLAQTLCVEFHDEHPLVPPRVTAEPASMHDTQWIVLYLAYQNGSLLNAAKMWVRAARARAAAAPQCYVCYCRLLPARRGAAHCRQCRNAFHTHCLRKWFATSKKSNCPICRCKF